MPCTWHSAALQAVVHHASGVHCVQLLKQHKLRVKLTSCSRCASQRYVRQEPPSLEQRERAVHHHTARTLQLRPGRRDRLQLEHIDILQMAPSAQGQQRMSMVALGGHEATNRVLQHLLSETQASCVHRQLHSQHELYQWNTPGLVRDPCAECWTKRSEWATAPALYASTSHVAQARDPRQTCSMPPDELERAPDR